jgi:hypothetical protein
MRNSRLMVRMQIGLLVSALFFTKFPQEILPKSPDQPRR